VRPSAVSGLQARVPPVAGGSPSRQAIADADRETDHRSRSPQLPEKANPSRRGTPHLEGFVFRWRDSINGSTPRTCVA
jgi:hypothetical protein